MKRILFLFLLLLLPSGIYGQNAFNMIGGRTKVLTWTEQGDYTGYTLIFVVKATKEISSPRLIQKTATATLTNQYTIVKCTLNVSDTEDFTTNAYYYYDVVGYGDDTVTVAEGRLNIFSPTQTSFDGANLPSGGTRVTTVALDNGTVQNEMIAWDATLTKWVPSGVTYNNATLAYFFDAIRDSLAQPLKKIYGVITNSAVTTWDVYGFNSDATYSISGDTLVIADASGELNLESIIKTSNQDYSIVGTPTTSELKIEWGGFTGKTISFVWELDTLSNAFPIYSGTSNTYNYGFDTTYVYQQIALKAPITTTNALASDISLKLSKVDFDDSLGVHLKTGTDSIHYGQDSIVVTHGVGSTPSFVSIQLTSNNFGFPIWINTIGSTTFAVKRSNIGLETISNYIKFKWMAYK